MEMYIYTYTYINIHTHTDTYTYDIIVLMKISSEIIMGDVVTWCMIKSENLFGEGSNY